jgi:hypothetical protein
MSEKANNNKVKAKEVQDVYCKLVYADVDNALRAANDVRRALGVPIALVYREYGMPFIDHKAMTEKTIIRCEREFSFRKVSELVTLESPTIIRTWY